MAIDPSTPDQMSTSVPSMHEMRVVAQQDTVWLACSSCSFSYAVGEMGEEVTLDELVTEALAHEWRVHGGDRDGYQSHH